MGLRHHKLGVDILSGNDYKRGWEEGRSDALAGLELDYRAMGLSWKYALYGRSVLDSYADGYRKGYDCGLAERNVVSRVESINYNQVNSDGTMSKAQEILREYQSLVDLYKWLVMFVDRGIMDTLNHYHGTIQALIDTGVPREACEKYINDYWSQDRQHYKQLLDHIVEGDLPRIRIYMESVERQFQVASGGMSIGNVHLPYPDLNPRPQVGRHVHTRSGDTADFVVQADALCDLGDFLSEVRGKLQRALQDYESYCNEMLEAGVPRQIYEDYMRQYVPEDVRLINKVRESIEQQDLPYLRGLLLEITQSLSILGEGYSRTIKNV